MEDLNKKTHEGYQVGDLVNTALCSYVGIILKIYMGMENSLEQRTERADVYYFDDQRIWKNQTLKLLKVISR